MRNIQRIYTHNALPEDEYLLEHRGVDASGTLIGYVSHVRIDGSTMLHQQVLAWWKLAGSGTFDYDLDVIFGDADEELMNVATIGDIVVISVTQRTTYHIYRGGAYVLNQSLQDLPEIEIGITDYRDIDDPLTDPPLKKSYQETISSYLEFLRQKKDDDNEYNGHIFMIAAYRMADNTLVRHSLPYYHPVYRFNTTDGSVIDNGIKQFIVTPPSIPGVPDSSLSFTRYRMLAQFTRKVKYYIEHSVPPDWSEVIKSIDLFCMYVPVDIVPETMTFTPDEDEETNYFKERDLEDVFKNGIFHKVDSIQITKDEEGSVDIDVEKDLVLKHLETKENLIPDQLSLHELCFHRSMTYNGRVHVADTLTYLYEGYKWGLPYMDWQKTNNDHLVKLWTGLASSGGSVVYSLVAADYNLISTGSLDQPVLRVKVQTGDGERDVFRSLDTFAKVVKSGAKYIIVLPKFFTYPHPGAKNFDILFTDSDGNGKIVYSGVFTPHEMYSFCYHIFETPSIEYNTSDTITLDQVSVKDEWSPVRQPNRLQLSGIENPFYWPTVNSYRIGEDKHNRINAMAVQSAPTSEGQFGEFPLVVFARNGIYLVDQGQGDVVYSSVINISNLEANPGVMGIDGLIIFTTKDDLYVLEGRSPKLLSRAIISNKVYTTQTSTDDIDPLTDPVGGLTFIQGLIFGYDSQYREIIMANPAYEHHYKFVPELGYFGIATQGFDGFMVKHGSYQGYTIGESIKIYDLNNDETVSSVDVYFKTNPQSFGITEFKRFLRLGYFCEGETVTHLSFLVFGENRAEETFPLIQKAVLGVEKDFMYLIAGRSPYSVRYFIFVLSGDVKPESVFHYIETELTASLPGRIR